MHHYNNFPNAYYRVPGHALLRIWGLIAVQLLMLLALSHMIKKLHTSFQSSWEYHVINTESSKKLKSPCFVFFFKVKLLSEWTKCGAKGPELELHILNVLRAKNAKCQKAHFWQMCGMQQELCCPLWWPPHSHLCWEPACTSIVHLVDQMEREGSHVLTGVLRNESGKMVGPFLLTPDQAHHTADLRAPLPATPRHGYRLGWVAHCKWRMVTFSTCANSVVQCRLPLRRWIKSYVWLADHFPRRLVHIFCCKYDGLGRLGRKFG